MTSKSSFEALEEISPEEARVEMTYQVQQGIMSTAEHDMVSIQACQMGCLGEAPNKNMEAYLKKVSQVSKSRSAKNLGIKNPKTLKR